MRQNTNSNCASPFINKLINQFIGNMNLSLTSAMVGGGLFIASPPVFFRNISKVSALIVGKLSVHYSALMLHVMSKRGFWEFDKSVENDVMATSCSVIFSEKQGLAGIVVRYLVLKTKTIGERHCTANRCRYEIAMLHFWCLYIFENLGTFHQKHPFW